MVVTTFSYEQIESWVGGAFWPFLRIGACLMVAPMFGASYVPARVRIVLAGALTLVALPMIPRPDGLTVLSADGVVTTVQQIVIGAALGFVLQMIFDAINFGGQVIANGMGLGLAFSIDPLLNIETPALGQLYVMLGSLTFLALDGHLALIDTIVTSFRGLPVGPSGFSVEAMRSLADWGDQLFIGALRVALPGMTALLVINLAFGAVSRAAPALNMFAIGLPVALIFGLIVLFFGLPTMQAGFIELMKSAFQFIQGLTAGGLRT
jgi:flagellar biosynthetic protein FliR